MANLVIGQLYTVNNIVCRYTGSTAGGFLEEFSPIDGSSPITMVSNSISSIGTEQVPVPKDVDNGKPPLPETPVK